MMWFIFYQKYNLRICFIIKRLKTFQSFSGQSEVLKRWYDLLNIFKFCCNGLKLKFVDRRNYVQNNFIYGIPDDDYDLHIGSDKYSRASLHNSSSNAFKSSAATSRTTFILFNKSNKKLNFLSNLNFAAQFSE